MNTSFYYQKEKYPTQSIKELLKPVIERANLNKQGPKMSKMKGPHIIENELDVNMHQKMPSQRSKSNNQIKLK